MSIALNWLLDGIAVLPANDARVEDLTLDSREVRSGSLFLALGGRQSHGLEHAAEAAARGARAVLWEPQAQPRWSDGPDVSETAPAAARRATDGLAAAAAALPASVFAAPVAGLRQLLGRIADRFFGCPSSHLRVVGITGTNGKTTCAYLLAQCLGRLKSEAAYIGTLGWGRIGTLEMPSHTTPDVITVHRQLATLRAAGAREVAMEVSSHALDQGRVDGVRFQAAAFTNLTRDHLDYHLSMEAYGAAKARLFSFPDLRHAIVNIGDPFGRDYARSYARQATLTAVWVDDGAVRGTRQGDDQGHHRPRLGARSLYVSDVALDLNGVVLALDGSFGKAQVKTRLLGRFNAENAVIVLACLMALDAPLAAAAAALAGCSPPPGRMEVIESASRGKPLAVIDYAHTPDALAKALNAAREHCRGALWCVFGCGGDRDPGKRPLMGAIADRFADRVIVTDDNPRSENPESITRGIVQGMTRRRARVIHDRGEAIATALQEAAANDLVLIAGKGHEDYQIYGTSRRRFSDRSEALRHLGAVA